MMAGNKALTHPEKNKNNKRILIFLIFIFVCLIIKSAWVCDDAYISFRTVYNFVNGYGLTWNIAERVQGFTHPLWLFVLSIFYFITREPFYTTVFVSLAFSIAAVIWFGFRLAKSTVAAVLGESRGSARRPSRIMEPCVRTIQGQGVRHRL